MLYQLLAVHVNLQVDLIALALYIDLFAFIGNVKEKIELKYEYFSVSFFGY